MLRPADSPRIVWRTRLSTRAVSILAVSAALALATTACSGADDTGATGAPTTSSSTATAAPSTTGAAGGSATPVPSTTKAAGGSTTGASDAAGQVCPVTTETLLAAMRADKNGGSRLTLGATLGKPECHDGYVLVEQGSIKDENGNPVADDEVASFKYESGGWRYQGSHSADYCDGMPAATAKYFRNHFSGGCAGS